MSRVVIASLWLAAACAGAAAPAPPAGGPPGPTEHIARPLDARIAVSAAREQYYLGEPIVLTFKVSDAGAAPLYVNLGGDYRGVPRALRFHVSAVREDGVRAPDPYTDLESHYMGGLSGWRTVTAADPLNQELRLWSYAYLPGPATYRVQVEHDLGWTKAAGQPAPGAETTVRVVMPTPAEAAALIENVRAGGDLTSYAYPVYVPALAKRAGQGSVEAVRGMGCVPGREATAALIRLVRVGAGKTQTQAAMELANRAEMPALPKALLRDRWLGYTGAEVRPFLQRESWTPELVGDAAAAAAKALATRDWEQVEALAKLTWFVGRAQDGPAVARTVNALAAAGGVDHYGWFSGQPKTNAAFALMGAFAAEVARGYRPPARPTTPADLFAFVWTLRADPRYRPAGWQETYLAAVNSPVQFVCRDALYEMPDDVRAALSKRLVEPVRGLMSDRDPEVARCACEIAAKLDDPTFGAPALARLAKATDWMEYSGALEAAQKLAKPHEWLTVMAERLDEPLTYSSTPSYFEIMGRLMGVTRLNPASGQGMPDEAARRTLKRRWIAFLSAHGAELDAGTRYRPGSAELPLDMFPNVTGRTADGKEVPLGPTPGGQTAGR